MTFCIVVYGCVRACVRVCVCTCACMPAHDNSKCNQSRNIKFEFVAFYENSS